MRNRNRAASVVTLTILIAASWLAFMKPDARYIAIPGFACIIMFLWLCLKLWDRDKDIPFFDIGVFCSSATVLYTIYPLINYWLNGFEFGIIGDYRLHLHHPEPFELGVFHLRHVLYLFSFVVFYLAFRGKGIYEVGNVKPPNGSERLTIYFFYVGLISYFFVLQLTTGIRIWGSYESAAFEENIAAIASVPSLLYLMSSKLDGIMLLFKLALLLIVISRFKQKKWMFLLLAWVMAEIVYSIALKGPRTGLVLFLMSTTLFYHRMIKPLSGKFLLVSGSSLFLLFIFIGFWRQYSDFATLKMDLSQLSGSVFSLNNEFQSMLGTAYDVLMRKESGAYLPWYLYLNDFHTIIPPQQFLSFERTSAAEWYLREIGLSETGQGFMWGVITQSIVGLDWLELAPRGALLGYILAKIHNWYITRQNGYIETLVYVVLCLKIYNTFRNTTLSLLPIFIWEIIPFYIILRLGMVLFSFHARGQQRHVKVG